MTGRKNDDNDGDVKFIDKILSDDTELNELEDIEEPRNVISKVIEQHDIGLLKFDKDIGKAILSDALRTEIIKLSSKYFQSNEGPFLSTNNRPMNKTWFKRKLRNDRGQEVTRSWLVYSLLKSLHLISAVFSFPGRTINPHWSRKVNSTSGKHPKELVFMKMLKIIVSASHSGKKWKEM
ncbi:50s ribosomal protein l19 [Lasius niger]|uniref:50s ribosomal protein l19 n=1 Tax=Lasius niger TaxID=67767 RepID=A0A0J7KFW7_LASNI|nr:50s ribosomal protein l19 [Lasius niger]